MANKTANVMARVEPDIKEQAEAIMDMLGISTSTVINILYKQIIMRKAIPFPLAVPQEPLALDEMDEATFNAMMERGLREVKEGKTYPVEEVFERLKARI